MRTLSSDTDPTIERMQLAIVARLPAWRKLQLIAGMNAMLSGAAVGGIKKRHPDATVTEHWHDLDKQRVGAEAAQRLQQARAVRRIVPEEAAYVTGDPIPTTRAVIAALDRLAIPYYIGGSLASGVHGMYRATADVDIVAEIGEEHVDDIVYALGQHLYVDAEMIRDAIRHQSSFNVLDAQTGFKVDVFIPKGRAFDRSQFERRLLEPLTASGEASAYIASAEDTVLAKLEWYRASSETSDRQWNDILGVLKAKSTDLDRSYLRHWAAQLNLVELLDRAFDDAGIG